MTDQTSDDLVAFHEQFVDTILNEQEFDRLPEFVDENIVAQTNNSATEGIEAYRQSTLGLLGAFTQFEATVLDSYVDGDTVIARTRYSGVQTGAFMGIPSAESEVAWESVVIARVADGKFVDTYAIHDQISILGQLGAMDLPAL
ncbi:MAG: ester cyclase [Halobaculum sp.]